MELPKNSRNPARVGQVVGATLVAISGTVASIYALNRMLRHRKTQALLDTLPPSTDVGIEDNTAEPADDEFDPAEVVDDTRPEESLDTLTYEQLYQRAQQQDITGRSSMRKAELLTALRHADNS